MLPLMLAMRLQQLLRRLTRAPRECSGGAMKGISFYLAAVIAAAAITAGSAHAQGAAGTTQQGSSGSEVQTQPYGVDQGTGSTTASPTQEPAQPNAQNNAGSNAERAGTEQQRAANNLTWLWWLVVAAVVIWIAASLARGGRRRSVEPAATSVNAA